MPLEAHPGAEEAHKGDLESLNEASLVGVYSPTKTNLYYFDEEQNRI